MKMMNYVRPWVEQHTDIVLDMVRIYLGVGLALKAVFYMSHNDELMKLMDALGPAQIFPAAMAHYVILAHLVGGILLALGLLTRMAALAQIPILFVALFYLYLPKMMMMEPRQNLEFSALVLFLLTLFAVFGAGRWSVDHILSKKLFPSRTVGHGTRPSPAH
jgi:uncharacterized membrane protein YphA (DoxX/SURF4 family)